MIKNIAQQCLRPTLLNRFFGYTPTVTSTKTSQNTNDETEISKFKNMASYWWDEQGEMKPLHAMNGIRVPFIRDGLKNRGVLNPDFENSSTPLKDLNVLDVGCGGGLLCEPLSQLGANVTGIDACKELIEVARLHASENRALKNKINYIHGLLEDVVLDNKDKYDVVVSSECLEHVNSQDLFLKCCVDVLKPGGSLFLTTLNKTTLSWLLGIVAAEYVLRLVPKGTHDWNKFIPPHEVQKILENYNCQTRVIHGCTYNFICNQWLWVPNTSVNYALHAVKITY